jgi:hypothetical protein
MAYFLFAYDGYYPGGGMSDYQGSFKTIEAATEHVRQKCANYEYIELAAIVEDELTEIGSFEVIGGNVEYISYDNQ